jgi:malic enzyme
VHDDRKGSARVGLPAMIAALAFVAFAKTSIGVIGAAAAMLIVYLVIGAVVSVGRRRPGPKDSPPDE